MAAAATVIHNHRRAEEEEATMQAEDDDLAEELDKDGDGQVDVDEMKAALKVKAVSVRAEIVQARLLLEKDLTIMCSKLPNFLLCVAAMIVALLEFSPAGDVANVHKHLNDHFKLDGLTDDEEGRVVDLKGIYSYFLDFAHKNEELQASSVKFWCEQRYATHKWDYKLLVPRWECRSPRQYALTLSTNKDWAWSAVNGEEDVDRRLGGSSSTGSVAGQAPECKDQDEKLREEEGRDDIACHNFTKVCEIDIGITLCPVTCKYCAPWQYEHTHRFDKPQVTMLPPVIYQTRFSLSECHGFATTYQAQPYNPALWKLPPLDGKKHGELLTCVDRSKPLEDDYALEVECPEGAPCENGVKKFTHKRSFHGETVYPKMLVEPLHDVQVLEAVQWLDAQTNIATVSTMVYTEDMEVFTSLTVDFTIDSAGNVNPTYNMVSYRDMLHGSKTLFIASLVVTTCGAMTGVFLTLVHLYRDRKQCRLGLVAFELFSRLANVVYPVFLLISWSQQLPMSVEYDHLLHTFLDLSSTSKSDMEAAYQKYFDVKTHIYGETMWLKRMKATAYVVLYIQFIQLILYMSAHPKMGVLTETISKALTHLVHFFFLFGLIFCSLGFVSHWMLGEYLKEFSTFGKTMESQARMMFGEFIYAEGAHHLSAGYTAMYWIYAGTYMLIVFFIMLNFFLAIIVDAFVDVKEKMEDKSAPLILNSLGHDVFLTLQANLRWRFGGWPPRGAFLDVLRRAIDEQTETSWVKQLACEEPEEDEAKPKLTVSIERLLAEVPGLTEDKLAQFLHHYFMLSPHVLCKRSKRKSVDAGGTSSKGSCKMGSTSVPKVDDGPSPSQPPPSMSPFGADFALSPTRKTPPHRDIFDN